MAYSLNKCREIRNRVDEVGIYETSIEYGITMDSVKRALRYIKEEGITNVRTEKRDCKLEGGHRVLCIGDLHAPFDLDEYFDFVCEVDREYAPTQIVFIGDVIDNHYASYHETDPDGMGGSICNYWKPR
jgi:hypothetical protein